MLDDDASEPDLPDAEQVYRNYLVTCRRLGVTAVPRDRAEELIKEWAVAIAAGLAVPTQH